MLDISYSKLRILIEIYRKFSKKKAYCYTSLAEEIEEERTNPYFREMVDLMEEKECLNSVLKSGSQHTFKIVKNKLSDLIRSTTIFNKIGDFIRADKPLDYNY